jgi:hypothetical protein
MFATHILKSSQKVYTIQLKMIGMRYWIGLECDRNAAAIKFAYQISFINRRIQQFHITKEYHEITFADWAINIGRLTLSWDPISDRNNPGKAEGTPISFLLIFGMTLKASGNSILLRRAHQFRGLWIESKALLLTKGIKDKATYERRGHTASTQKGDGTRKPYNRMHHSQRANRPFLPACPITAHTPLPSYDATAARYFILNMDPWAKK